MNEALPTILEAVAWCFGVGASLYVLVLVICAAVGALMEAQDD